MRATPRLQLTKEHAWVVHELGVMFTHKQAVTTRLLTMVRNSLGSATSMAATAAALKDQHVTRFMSLRLAHAHLVKSWRTAALRQLSSDGQVVDVAAIDFGGFDDATGYSGKAPKAPYLVRGGIPRVHQSVCRTQLACSRTQTFSPSSASFQLAVGLADFDRLLPIYRARLMMITGDVLKGDYTFKLAKKVQCEGGTPFDAVYSVMNEYNEVLGSWFLRGKEQNLVRVMHIIACSACFLCAQTTRMRAGGSSVAFVQAVRAVRRAAAHQGAAVPGSVVSATAAAAAFARSSAVSAYGDCGTSSPDGP
jgi:hypothetical protein